MRRIRLVGLGALALGWMMTGCGDEDPTAVGADLLAPAVRTFDVELSAAEFLTADTTYDQIGDLDDAPFRMVAHEFEETLEARTLISITRPLTVTYTPGEGQSSVTDTIEAVVGGTLTVVVDTLATTPGPVELELFRVTEEWDRAAATWETRLDTADVTETWSTPGGSPGQRLGSATWETGDTLRIVMDSAAAAVWDDTAAARIGGVLRSTTPGTRLFVQALTFQFDVVPVGADTVVAAGSVGDSKIILTPQDAPPSPAVLRVGGLPAWRSAVMFRPVADLRIPCGPDQPPDCTLGLDEVTINLAAVLLEPLPAGVRRVERPMRVEGRAVLEAAGVPLVRSPLSPPLGPPSDTLSAALFHEPATEPVQVAVPITTFIRTHLNPPTGVTDPPLWMAITALGERGAFGYGAFGGVGSDRPPRLRLVVSVPDEVGIR